VGILACRNFTKSKYSRYASRSGPDVIEKALKNVIEKSTKNGIPKKLKCKTSDSREGEKKPATRSRAERFSSENMILQPWQVVKA